MKYKLLFFVLVSLFSMNCMAGCISGPGRPGSAMTEKPVCDAWLHPDSVAYQALGRRLSNVLYNASSVKVYSLVPKETVNPDDYVVEDCFVRDSFLGTLNKEQAVVLKYNLFSNGANYQRDTSYIVMSPYYPVIEFEFTKRSEVAHVIISLSDFSWSIKYDDRILFNYNYAGGTFVKRFCDYFLKKD